jgi:hypothetical protein
MIDEWAKKGVHAKHMFILVQTAIFTVTKIKDDTELE